MRFIGFVEDCTSEGTSMIRTQTDEEKGLSPKSNLYLYTTYATPKYTAPKMTIRGCTTLYSIVITNIKIA